jgi:hypothetical protein
LKVIHRYETFGLQTEWVKGFLRAPASFVHTDYLGPRQRVALKRYLGDIGICDAKQNLTPIGELLSETLQGPKWADYAWGCMWASLCAEVPVFAWYSALANRVWTPQELLEAMEANWPEASERTLRNARSELLGTIKYTPIGVALGQGLPMPSCGRGVIEKRGADKVSAYWALFCIALLEPEGLTIPLDSNSARGRVAQVLGVSNQVLASALEALWQPDLFTIHQEGEGQLQVRLVPGVTPEIILRRWIQEDN